MGSTKAVWPVQLCSQLVSLLIDIPEMLYLTFDTSPRLLQRYATVKTQKARVVISGILLPPYAGTLVIGCPRLNNFLYDISWSASLHCSKQRHPLIGAPEKGGRRISLTFVMRHPLLHYCFLLP